MAYPRAEDMSAELHGTLIVNLFVASVRIYVALGGRSMSAEFWAVAGILATFVVGLVGVFFAKKVKKSKQTQKIGRNSVGIQAGRDANMGTRND